MSGKEVVGSILISLILMSAIVFFALPFIFPGVSEKNIVVQSKYAEWKTTAMIYDSETTAYKKISDTELNITIQESSSLAIVFSADAILHLSDTFTVKNSYFFSVVVEGVGNKTFFITYFDSSAATGSIRELTYNLYVNYVTNPLPAGTYNVAVYWQSRFDANGSNFLSLAHSGYNYSRSLWIQELSVALITT